MTFSLALELVQVWTDGRLNYPDWLNTTYELLDSHWKDKLWNPNIYFVNAVDGKLDNIIMPSSYFWFTKQKVIHFLIRVMLKLICEMDLHYFPHDDQECSLKMSSALFHDKKVVFSLENGTRKGSFGLQQFHLVRYYDKSCTLNLTTINVSCVERVILLRRRSGYFVINVYIPTVLIVVMSMLTFWIPPDAVPARVTLGVTSLLTIITKQYQASLPSVSYIVALNVWLSSCIGFVFCSLLEYATVIAMTTRNKNEERLSSSLRGVSNLNLLPIVMLRANRTWSLKNSWTRKEKIRRCSPMALDKISRVFFPVSFVLFCAVYWCYYRI